MAYLKREEIPEKQKTHQSICFKGKIFNILLREARDKDVPLSQVVNERLLMSYRQEGII